MSSLIVSQGRSTSSTQALVGLSASDAMGLPKPSSSIDDKQRFDDYLNDAREPARSSQVDRDDALDAAVEEDPVEKRDVENQTDDTRDVSRDLDRKDSVDSLAEDERAATGSTQDAKTAAEPQDASESEDPASELGVDSANTQASNQQVVNAQINGLGGAPLGATGALSALGSGVFHPLVQPGAKQGASSDAKQSAVLSPEARAIAAAASDVAVVASQGEQGASGQSLEQGLSEGGSQAFGQGSAGEQGVNPLEGAIKFGQQPVLQTESTNTAPVVSASTTSSGQLTAVDAKGANAQQAVNALQDASNTGSDVNAARLARGMRSAVMQQNGAVTLRLTPNAMGTVRIELNVQGGAVQASLSAETDGARQLLQQQIGHLKSALESQGLTVQRLEVQSMQTQQSSGSQNTEDQSSADGRGRQAYSGRQDQQSQRDENGQRFEDLAQELNQELNQEANQDPSQDLTQTRQGSDVINEGVNQ